MKYRANCIKHIIISTGFTTTFSSLLMIFLPKPLLQLSYTPLLLSLFHLIDIQ